MTTSKNHKWGARLILIILFLNGCSLSESHDRFVAIPNRAWESSFRPSLEVRVPDAATPYRIYLNFRHTHQYRYSNVFLMLHEQSPDGETSSERFELKLAEADGRWIGKNSGNLYTHQQLIVPKHHFVDSGTYTFTLEQVMRDDPLMHVVAAGLRIEAISPSTESTP